MEKEMTFKYRRAKNKDLKSMAWLVTCNIGTCDLKPEIDVHVNDEAIFQRNLNTIDVSKYYVCEKNGEIIGLCGIDKSCIEDCDEILYLVVASSYRKLGIGTKLLELCCNSTDKDVLYEAWGDGSEVNSKHILEKLGFKLIENKGDEFYKDNGYCNLCVNRNKTNCNSCKCEIWKLNHNTPIESEISIKQNREMTVKELIEELSYYNPNALITVGDNLYNGISISISGGDACTKLECDFVCFDKSNKQENNESTSL